ncbi:unnamed protein product [Peniophora sp. CBMAI 1063]|nr:unnamed protein product [Peniophora sp. CBMAI 1063]
MPALLSPTYPSFALVVTEAFFDARPPPTPATRHTDSLRLPSRYEPYPRPSPRLDEPMMTTVDYRWSPPPTTSYHFGASRAMMDVDDSSAESDESHFLAVYNLDTAVNGLKPHKPLLARRPSLSTVVVDLALLLKASCKKLLAPATNLRATRPTPTS